ncbi:uncharacterized protein [Nicotiana tomentosiformis]|uniref:uncharacterized protein n=1 Tax=Nicotiana tomentosiformis TaxID=4098 RepID=UPI00388CAC66
MEGLAVLHLGEEVSLGEVSLAGPHIHHRRLLVVLQCSPISELCQRVPTSHQLFRVSPVGIQAIRVRLSVSSPPLPRGCYECGNPGHRLRGKAVQQGHQPMITAPAAAPAIWLPIGGGHVGRGRPRGRGQSGGGQPGGALARFYAFQARPDGVASNAVITGIISVCGRDASVLFDPGYTYSYVSSMFAYFLGVYRESLGTPIYVSTPVGDSVVVYRIYRSCIVTFCGYKTRANLLLLDMTDFEVILGMDWLSPYHAILDCHAKTVTLAMPEFPRLE